MATDKLSVMGGVNGSTVSLQHVAGDDPVLTIDLPHAHASIPLSYQAMKSMRDWLTKMMEDEFYD